MVIFGQKTSESPFFDQKSENFGDVPGIQIVQKFFWELSRTQIALRKIFRPFRAIFAKIEKISKNFEKSQMKLAIFSHGGGPCEKKSQKSNFPKIFLGTF